MEDKVVEIIDGEQKKKEKGWRETRTVQETSGTTASTLIHTFVGSQKEKETGGKHTCDIMAEKFPNLGHLRPRSSEFQTELTQRET